MLILQKTATHFFHMGLVAACPYRFHCVIPRWLNHERFRIVLLPRQLLETARPFLRPQTKKVREQISREWVQDLSLITEENSELARHCADAIGLDVESAEKTRKLVFDHGELMSPHNTFWSMGKMEKKIGTCLSSTYSWRKKSLNTKSQTPDDSKEIFTGMNFEQNCLTVYSYHPLTSSSRGRAYMFCLTMCFPNNFIPVFCTVQIPWITRTLPTAARTTSSCSTWSQTRPFEPTAPSSASPAIGTRSTGWKSSCTGTTWRTVRLWKWVNASLGRWGGGRKRESNLFMSPLVAFLN